MSLVPYLNRMVDEKNFRVYVYGKNSSQKIVNNYEEFQEALASGEWHASVEDVPKLKRPGRPVRKTTYVDCS